MASPITLDEFFNMAASGGQLKACHDIFKILQSDATPAEISQKLSDYQSSVLKEFKSAQLRFKMGGGKVRTDIESIETL